MTATTSTHTLNNNHLKRVLNFGDSDLEMNRRGLISETQRARLEKERQGSSQLLWSCGAVCVVIGGLLGLFVIALSNQPITNYLNFILLIALVAGLLIAFSAYRMQSTARQDLALNRVESTTGLVKRHTEQYEGVVRYYITINDKSYGVPQAVYEAFKEGVVYRLYHTASAFTLMSVEEMS